MWSCMRRQSERRPVQMLPGASQCLCMRMRADHFDLCLCLRSLMLPNTPVVMIRGRRCAWVLALGPEAVLVQHAQEVDAVELGGARGAGDVVVVRFEQALA